MKTIDESDIVSEVVRRSLCGELRQASLDVLVALFSAEPGDEDLSADADTGEESSLDDYKTSTGSAVTSTPSIPPGLEWMTEQPISLVPRKAAHDCAAHGYGCTHSEPQSSPEAPARLPNQKREGTRYRHSGQRKRALCSVDGCESLATVGGMCNRHANQRANSQP